MFILDARFATLLILCGIAVNPLSPCDSHGVHAAVITRGTQKEVSTQWGHSDHKQAFFASPWSHKAQRNAFRHRVRSIDYPMGPPFITALLTYLQHPRSLDGRSQKSIGTPHDGGAKYVVSHSRRAATTPQWVATPGNQTNFNSTNAPDPTGMTSDLGGIVELTSDATKDSKTIAYLMQGAVNDTKVLEATSSKAEASVMSLTKALSIPKGSSPVDKDSEYCNLCDVKGNPRLCATFDRSAFQDQPIQLRPQIQDDSDSGSNMTQVFMHNRITHKLTPVSFVGSHGGSAKSSSTSESSSISASDNSTSTSGSSMPSASTAPQTRRGESSSSVQAQNVTLIFIPQEANRKAGAMDIKQDPSVSTVTQTVTVYSSGYPTASAANATAASATSSLASSAVPSGSASGMNVELVGNPSSSGSPSLSPNNTSSSVIAKAAAVPSQASSISASGVFGTASVAASPSASASVDAAAIAASLASSYRSAARSSSSDVASSSSGSGSAFGVASASPSPSASPVSSIQPAAKSVLAAAAWKREAAPAVQTANTDPYTWKFSPESR